MSRSVEGYIPPPVQSDIVTPASESRNRKVSELSHWNDARWVLDADPHVAKSQVTIIWDWFEAESQGATEEVRRLDQTGKHFVWYLLHLRDAGPMGTSSAVAQVRIVARLVRYLIAERDCATLTDATVEDLEAFVRAYIEALDPEGEGVAKGTMYHLYAAVLGLRDAAPYLSEVQVDHLSTELWAGHTVQSLTRRHKLRQRTYVHAVPEPAGRLIVQRSYEFLDRCTGPVRFLLMSSLEPRCADRYPNTSKQVRSDRANKALRQSITVLHEKTRAAHPEVKGFADELLQVRDQPNLPIRTVGRAVSNLVGAALIVIQALTGARQSEVKQLTIDCVQREVSTDGRWYFYFLSVPRTKNNEGLIRVFVGKCSTATPPPDHNDVEVIQHRDRSRLPLPVLAVAAMRALREPARKSSLLPNDGNSLLFPSEQSKWISVFSSGPLSPHQFVAKQRAFVDDRPELSASLRDSYELLASQVGLEDVPSHFASHDWRKWFTEAVVSYEQRDEDYPELQKHLGHVVHSIVTREHYAAGDIEYRRFEDNVLQERAARAVLRVLEGREAAVGSLARSLLANQEAILKRLTSPSISDRSKALRRYLEDNGVTIVAAGNNSGLCAYKADTAKCWDSLTRTKPNGDESTWAIPGRDWIGEVGTAPLGPNRALARASLCRRCANFMLTEDHFEYWLDTADDLTKLADTLEANPAATEAELYEAHAHRANALDYISFVESSMRRMRTAKPSNLNGGT